MSVSVAEAMQLPCLREASVIAGKNGLNRLIAAVSVLECYDDDSVMDDLYEKIIFNGGELIISCFAGVKTDVDAQCTILRKLSATGDVGLILYYVGMILPAIDKRLIQLADELNFPLICMPENLYNLRYSEVISEVEEAILKDQIRDTYFVPEILDRISMLPSHQRSMDALLKMLSDRTHFSIILANGEKQAMGYAMWPRFLENSFDKILEQCNGIMGKKGVVQPISLDKKTLFAKSEGRATRHRTPG
ncbi:MAG: PucR family transcriptional regulator ligand-binding domain-containing protein [Lachnospiraceae bacterium]|nr:PucR family transcriptional regulator ligand-binding domain-containing protein [Lachnospiraceae bacterium]